MSELPLHVAVLVGSTREGRFGGAVAQWMHRRLRARLDMVVDVIDLIDIDLPMIYPQQPEPAVQDYLGRIDRADAFIVITPEYNHGYPASLKQAIDLPRDQWRRKPVAFVSYGGIGGGLRAVEQLRQVFAELHTVTIRDSVSFHMAWSQFDESGEPRDRATYDAAATTMLDHLAWWATALRTARSADAHALKVIVVGGSREKMRVATGVLDSHGFSATGAFSEDEACDAIAAHDELFAVVAGGFLDEAAQRRLRTLASAKGGVLITAHIGHDDPGVHFTNHVLPQLIEARRYKTEPADLASDPESVGVAAVRLRNGAREVVAHGGVR
jgi:NAD(P)H-dependent FMN reductase